VKNEQAEWAQTIVSDDHRPRAYSPPRVVPMEMRDRQELGPQHQNRDNPRRQFDSGDNRGPRRGELDHPVLAKTSS
jgi:hypothetical protein